MKSYALAIKQYHRQSAPRMKMGVMSMMAMLQLMVHREQLSEFFIIRRQLFVNTGFCWHFIDKGFPSQSEIDYRRFL
jgi:hypothetical protein